MAQKQLPVPTPPPGDDDKKPDLSRKLPKAPQAQELTDNIDAANTQKEKRKTKEPECCGILPCKGRSQFCYQCDICLDCITSVGCGHDSSRHTMRRIVPDAEK